VGKQTRITPHHREVLDLEILPEALLDLAATLDERELEDLLSTSGQSRKRGPVARKSQKGTAA